MNNVNVGLKSIGFGVRGKMEVKLTDGRSVIVPLSSYPDIKRLSMRQRNEWMILDDQFFTFNDLSKVYSITDMMGLS